MKSDYKKILAHIKGRVNLPYEMIAAGIGFFFKPLKKIPKFQHTYYPLFSMINKMYTKSFTSTLLSFWFSLVIILVVAPLFSPQFAYIGTVGIVPMVISAQVMPAIFIELKGSSILKRIGTTSIKISQLVTTLVLYFSGIIILSLIFNAGIGFAILINNKSFFPSEINWGFLIFSMLYAIPLSLGFGILIASICKSSLTASGLGLIFMLIGGLVSGQFVPISLLNSQWGKFRYIAYVFPQTVYSKLMLISSNGGNPFSLKDHQAINFDLLKLYQGWLDNPQSIPKDIKITPLKIEYMIKLIESKNPSTSPILIASKWENTLSLFAPIFITLVILPLSIKTFKWQVR